MKDRDLLNRKNEVAHKIEQRNKMIELYWQLVNTLYKEIVPDKKVVLEQKRQQILKEIEILYSESEINELLNKIRAEEIKLYRSSCINGDKPYRIK